MDGLNIFPANGLDRSIMASVFTGVLLMTVASETLGWTFAGLVVPGYLAAVFAISPVTGAAIVLESVMAYALARAIGSWLPAIDAWSQAFGRERFFIVIAASLFVRLGCEGYLFPWLGLRFDFGRASELYSIGLVLIPLVANSAWNVGLVRGAAQNTLTTLLTYAILTRVLLPWTNLSLSKIELSFERVALDFLAAPKAYLVLLVGTIFGARTNVRYGWDFNGILVPGLLAVAWYTPLKLAATLVEAVVVAALSQRLVTTRLLRGYLIEGPRRLLLVFCVGFSLKIALGFVFARALPAETVTDFYGFGYVLPTLLSMKIWQYGSVPRVLMPTLFVSFIGFVGGNLLGLWLSLVWPGDSAERALPPLSRGPLALQLMLQATPPQRSFPTVLDGERREALLEVVEQLLRRDVDGGLRRARRDGIAVRRYSLLRSGSVFNLRVARGGYAPALAVAPRGYGALVIRAADLQEGAAVGARLMPVLEPALLVVLPARAPGIEALLDPLLAGFPAAVRRLSIADRYRLSGATAVDARRLRSDGFRSVGGALELSGKRLAVLRASLFDVPLEDPPEISWRDLDEQWTIDVPDPEGEPPDRARLRAMSDALLPRLSRWAEGEELSLASRALLRWHGLVVRRLVDPEGLVIASDVADGGSRRFLWVVLRGSSSLVVDVPHAARERGSVKLAKELARRLGARHLLLHEVRTKVRDTTGRQRMLRRTAIQRALEGLLAQGAFVVQVHERSREDAPPGVDAVVAPAADVGPVPAWARDVTYLLEHAGWKVASYDGTQPTAFARGTAEPLMEYARALYTDRVVAVWTQGSLRATLRQRTHASTVAWLQHGGLRQSSEDVATALSRLGRGAYRCEAEELRRQLTHFWQTHNPYDVVALARLSRACNALLVDDPRLGGPFLIGAERYRKFGLRLGRPQGSAARRAASPDAAALALGLGAEFVVLEQVRP